MKLFHCGRMLQNSVPEDSLERVMLNALFYSFMIASEVVSDILV
jgi:hypothetical protein